MKSRLMPIVAVAALLLVNSSPAATASSSSRDYFEAVPEQIYAGVPFDMPRVPVQKIPDRSVSIVDFGAVADGKFLNTDALSRAIRHV